MVSTNLNGQSGSNILSQNSSTFRSSKRVKVKKFIFKKIFTDDDAYADGEYEKNSVGVADSHVNISKPKGERENWSGKFDFFLSCLVISITK